MKHPLVILLLLLSVVSMISIGILLKRKMLSRIAFDKKHSRWFIIMEIDDETEQNEFIKNEIYWQYTLAYDNFSDKNFNISKVYDELMSNKQFKETLETLQTNKED